MPVPQQLLYFNGKPLSGSQTLRDAGLSPRAPPRAPRALMRRERAEVTAGCSLYLRVLSEEEAARMLSRGDKAVDAASMMDALSGSVLERSRVELVRSPVHMHLCRMGRKR